MAKTPRKTAETDRSLNSSERGLTSGELLANWSSCVTDFYTRRLEKYWQYPFALAGMRSFEEVAHSFVEFETKLLGDYADHANELQRIVLGKRRDTQRAPGEQYEARLLEAQRDAGLIIEQAKAQAERILNSARSQAEQMTATEEVTPLAARKRA
jgi:hypothetical protein